MNHSDEIPIAQNPKNPKAFAQRGESYRQMKRFSEALVDFNKAIELSPNYAWAYAHRGVVYRRLLRYDEALADFNKAIELKPDYAWAYAYRGVMCSIANRYEDATIEFEKAIAIDENIITHWGNERGFPLTRLGRYAEAIECYDRTLTVRPNDPLAVYCIAVTQALWQGLENAGEQIDRARTVLRSMLDAEKTQENRFLPDSGEKLQIPNLKWYSGSDIALYGLGGLAALEDNFDEALNYLQAAISFEYDLNVEMVRNDPAWFKLHGDSRFETLISYKNT